MIPPRYFALGFLLFGLLSWTCSAEAQNARPTEKVVALALLELSADDSSSFSSPFVVEACSDALAKPEKWSAEQIKRFHQLRGDALFELGRYADAKLDYDYLLKCCPDNKEFVFTHAQILFYADLPGKAVEEIKRLARGAPNDAKALKALATASGFCGDWESTAKYAAKAIEKEATSPQLYMIRGRAYFQLGRFRECLDDLEKFFTLSSGSAPKEQFFVHILRGETLLRLGDPDRALTDYLIARQLDPTSGKAVQGAFRCYFGKEKYNVSLALAEQMVKLNSKDFQAHAARAFALWRLRCPGEALEALQTANAIEPEDPVVLSQMGLAKVHLGKYKSGFECLDRAIRLDPRSGFAFSNKALALIFVKDKGFKDPRHAVKLSQRACLLAKDNAEFFFVLALSRINAGEYEEGLEALKKAQGLAGEKTSKGALYAQLVRRFEAALATGRPIQPLEITHIFQSVDPFQD